jgi:hypothetical protein
MVEAMKHFIVMHWIRVKHIAPLAFATAMSLRAFHRALWRNFTEGVRNIWAVGRN